MASSKNEICNMALSYIGQDKSVEDIDNPKKAEERVLKLWYTQTRRSLFRTLSPNFAIKRDIWSLSSFVPATDYAYAYLIPKDCINLLTVDERPIGVLGIVEGGYFLTNNQFSDGLNVKYTYDEKDVNKYDDDFCDLLAIELAMKICLTTTSNQEKMMLLEQLKADRLATLSVMKTQENPLKIVNESKILTIKRRGYR